MSVEQQSIVAIVDPRQSRLQPLTAERLEKELRSEHPDIAKRIRVQQMENSSRVRLDFTAVEDGVMDRFLMQKIGSASYSGPKGDSREIPDYEFAVPEESYGPTYRMLKELQNAQMPDELKTRLQSVCINIFSSHQMWIEHQNPSRALRMLYELCSQHIDAADVLLSAAREWSDTCMTGEFDFPEENVSDFTMINEVLAKFGKGPVPVPVRQAK